MRDLKNVIEVGIDEEPDNFRYTKYIIEMIDKLDLRIKNISEVTYQKIISEFVKFLQ